MTKKSGFPKRRRFLIGLGLTVGWLLLASSSWAIDEEKSRPAVARPTADSSAARPQASSTRPSRSPGPSQAVSPQRSSSSTPSSGSSSAVQRQPTARDTPREPSRTVEVSRGIGWWRRWWVGWVSPILGLGRGTSVSVVLEPLLLGLALLLGLGMGVLGPVLARSSAGLSCCLPNSLQPAIDQYRARSSESGHQAEEGGRLRRWPIRRPSERLRRLSGISLAGRRGL